MLWSNWNEAYDDNIPIWYILDELYIKVNIAWNITTLTKKELEEYLHKYPEYKDKYFII